MGQPDIAEYKPQFPKSHALLLDTYEHLMQAKGEKEIAVWADRFKGLMNTLTAMKDDDAVAVHFLKYFHLDVEDVRKQVHRDLDTGRLTQVQRVMGYAITNLAATFGKT